MYELLKLAVPRIIPADAGSTEQRSATPCSPQDHPRGCGEHIWNTVWTAIKDGSSPRMRGAHLNPNRARRIPGIIPADAGSTRVVFHIRAVAQDHPRGCGEHQFPLWSCASMVGSSPRMRGAHDGYEYRSYHVRIIPADAGSTKPGERRRPHPQDHPRGCGEHLPCGDGVAAVAGSSPRMRGAHTLDKGSYEYKGIIPTDAGSTQHDSDCTNAWRDHPHGCGEHSTIPKTECPELGSSPRMRGAHLTLGGHTE